MDKSRIFLTLSIPLGFLSILWLIRKNSTSKRLDKKTIVEESSEKPNQGLFPINCKSDQVDKICADMRFKNRQGAAEKQSQNTNGVKSYAAKGKKNKKLENGMSDAVKESVSSSSDEDKISYQNEGMIILGNGNGNINGFSAESEISSDDIYQNGNDESLPLTNGVVNGLNYGAIARKNQMNKSPEECTDTVAKDECREERNQHSCSRKLSLVSNTQSESLNNLRTVLSPVLNGHARNSSDDILNNIENDCDIDLCTVSNGTASGENDQKEIQGNTDAPVIKEECEDITCSPNLTTQSVSELNNVNSKDVAGACINGYSTHSGDRTSACDNFQNGTHSNTTHSLSTVNGVNRKKNGKKKKGKKEKLQAAKTLSEENHLHSQFHKLSVQSDSQQQRVKETNSNSAVDNVNIVDAAEGSITLTNTQCDTYWTEPVMANEHIMQPAHCGIPNIEDNLHTNNVITDCGHIAPIDYVIATTPEFTLPDPNQVFTIPVNYMLPNSIPVPVSLPISNLSPEPDCQDGSSNRHESPKDIEQTLDDEPVEYPMVYEFEIRPVDCGRLIGKNGRNVKHINSQTGVNILIRKHPFESDKKICTMHGTETQIDEALELIRKRFPIEHFPHVTLAQINGLPVSLQCPEALKLPFPEGVPFDVLLCATVHAGHFFVHQPTHPTFYNLSALCTAMTEDYSCTNAPMIQHVSAGNICAASLQSGWYRAEVVETFPELQQCRLKFLDFGGYANVPETAIRQIKCDYMTVPFQATECYLAGVMPIDGERFTDEAQLDFENLCRNKVLQGVVVGHSEDKIPLVNLYYIVGTQVIYINQEMINLNHAKAIPGSEEIQELEEENIEQ